MLEERILKGGSCYKLAFYLHCDWRLNFNPDFSSFNIGFRCVDGATRVLRGGTWLDPGDLLSCVRRTPSDTRWAMFFHGFRCVEDAKRETPGRGLQGAYWLDFDIPDGRVLRGGAWYNDVGDGILCCNRRNSDGPLFKDILIGFRCVEDALMPAGLPKRTILGGTWPGYGSEWFRCAARHFYFPRSGGRNVGFRCVGEAR